LSLTSPAEIPKVDEQRLFNGNSSLGEGMYTMGFAVKAKSFSSLFCTKTNIGLNDSKSILSCQQQSKTHSGSGLLTC